MATREKYAQDMQDMARSPRTSSSADEEVRLIGESPGGRPIRSQKSRSKVIIFALCLSNAISVVILLLVVLFQFRPGATRCEEPKEVFYPSKEAWFPPEIPVKKVLWGDDLYAREPDEESEMAWTRLLPLGRGQVKINNQSSIPDMPGYNQTGTEEDGLDLDNTAWVTVFHQLHCLYSTKDAYYRLYDPEKYAHGKRENGWSLEHLNHCWDHLRATLMCSADVTIEWHKYGEKVGTGWGYEHQCKDWDAIFKWTQDHRRTNDWGILRGGGERHSLGEKPSDDQTTG